MKILEKVKIAIEITICFFLSPMLTALVDGIGRLFHLYTDGLWGGAVKYTAAFLIIILYVTKGNKRPLSSVGLIKPSFIDIPKGLLLGLCMFAVQQLPLLFMGFRYSSLAAAPDWSRIIPMAVYIILFVGVSEELMFRGFILHKTQELLHYKTAAVVINGLLFYAFHWSRLTFSFGEFYNLVGNTLLLCLYFYFSKKKSIIPLMIGHSCYDLLTTLLPAILFYLPK